MMFRIRKPAWKLTGIVKTTVPEVFPEMKPLGNVIILSVILHLVSGPECVERAFFIYTCMNY